MNNSDEYIESFLSDYAFQNNPVIDAWQPLDYKTCSDENVCQKLQEFLEKPLSLKQGWCIFKLKYSIILYKTKFYRLFCSHKLWVRTDHLLTCSKCGKNKLQKLRKQYLQN
jgi:hypothetical protein